MKDFQAISNSGYCHCCRQQTTFTSNHSWLRDYYVCTNHGCGSVPRQRHLAYILQTHFDGWELCKIHESSPASDFIGRYCRDYSSSQFFSDVSLGDFKGDVRCENLEKLTFPDNTFDYVITLDVFEHIMDPCKASQEITRVLRPAGAHIFTAPRHKWIAKSYPRAKLNNGLIVNLHDESYHGNPIGDGRSLVTWDYGHDFEALYAGWSSCLMTTFVTRDRYLGLDGEYLDVFIARKPEAFLL